MRVVFNQKRALRKTRKITTGARMACSEIRIVHATPA
jgi:hypothetical protein